MIQEDIQIKSNNGHELFAHYWKPESTIHASITFVHGFGENCIRYTPYFEYFVNEGIAILGFDLYGHGQSEGKRGVIPSYEILLDDIQICIDKTKEIFPTTPHFLYGHSMGGNLVLNYLLKRKSDITGAVLTSPWLTLTNQPKTVLQKAVSALSKLIPNITIDSGLNINDISTIEEEVIKYNKDPLNHGRISFNLLNNIIKTGLWAIENVGELQIETLLVHGTEDKITSPESSRIIAEGSTLIEFKEWEGAYHELHNDFCRKDIANDIIKWIKN